MPCSRNEMRQPSFNQYDLAMVMWLWHLPEKVTKGCRHGTLVPLFFSAGCSAAWLLLRPMFIFCCYSNKPAATLCVSLKLGKETTSAVNGGTKVVLRRFFSSFCFWNWLWAVYVRECALLAHCIIVALFKQDTCMFAFIKVAFGSHRYLGAVLGVTFTMMIYCSQYWMWNPFLQ